jgi:hypothetical protein
VTRSSRGTKLEVSAVGSEHQKRTAPRLVGAWCRRHGFEGSPLCAEASRKKGSKLGGKPGEFARSRVEAFWAPPRGGANVVTPEPRVGRSIVPTKKCLGSQEYSSPGPLGGASSLVRFPPLSRTGSAICPQVTGDIRSCDLRDVCSTRPAPSPPVGISVLTHSSW